MIGKALETLKNELAAYLRQQPGLDASQNKIFLTGIVDNAGKVLMEADTLGMSLVKVEEERVNKPQVATRNFPDGRVQYVNPEIWLNLYVLIAANFVDYKSGLDYLAAVMQYFQSKSVFTPQNTPTLNNGVEKIVVELISLNFEQQNHLWGALGAKYLPSVIYKISVVIIQAEEVTRQGEAIRIIDIEGRGR